MAFINSPFSKLASDRAHQILNAVKDCTFPLTRLTELLVSERVPPSSDMSSAMQNGGRSQRRFLLTHDYFPTIKSAPFGTAVGTMMSVENPFALTSVPETLRPTIKDEAVFW